jgi:uncharacterized membrane protein YgdD (TMEM256/DUF423 family)
LHARVNSTLAFRIAAAFGFAAVTLGAFGAHGLKHILEANKQLANWQTAASYHLVHAVVLLLVSTLRPLPVWAWRFFAAGIVIFSGTLYVLAVTNIKILGAITPIGGVCLLAGWLALAFRRFGAE